jgi:hypothetical protein
MGFEFQLDQTMKLLFAASLLSMQHHGVGTKTGRLGVQDSVSEGSDRSTNGLLYQEASTIKTQLSIFV